MVKFSLQSIILLPILLLLVLPPIHDFQAGARGIVDAKAEVEVPDAKNSIPCAELRVTSAGVVCESKFGIVTHLDFPEVDLKGALADHEYLPSAQEVFTADEKTVGDKTYRNIALLLRWEPATPEFLQIYLNEYVPHWGNRVPYRLFWNAQYEECSLDHCTEWLTVSEKGEFLPSDVKDLPSDLAADVNFNGVPAAFWNTNLIP